MSGPILCGPLPTIARYLEATAASSLAENLTSLESAREGRLITASSADRPPDDGAAQAVDVPVVAERIVPIRGRRETAGRILAAEAISNQDRQHGED